MAIVFVRTIIIFLSLLFFMRILGKRQLGELELSELVVSVLVANLAALPLQDIGIPLLNGLIPVTILFCCELIITGITLKSIKARQLLFGKPSILVENGKINQREMKKCRFTLDELSEELRTQSILDIHDVQYAILETDGSLNVILMPPQRPVTAEQLKIPTENTGYFSMIINDGRILQKNLNRLGRDQNWLMKELKKRKISSPKEVYVMMLNEAGEIYFAEKEKQ